MTISIVTTLYFCIILFKAKWLGVRVFNFIDHKTKTTSLYDDMEINDEMGSSMVKEQLNHFRVKLTLK
jgi:hypothetical protein